MNSLLHSVEIWSINISGQNTIFYICYFDEYLANDGCHEFF
jgi:hypothetical protein